MQNRSTRSPGLSGAWAIWIVLGRVRGEDDRRGRGLSCRVRSAACAAGSTGPSGSIRPGRCASGRDFDPPSRLIAPGARSKNVRRHAVLASPHPRRPACRRDRLVSMHPQTAPPAPPRAAPRHGDDESGHVGTVRGAGRCGTMSGRGVLGECVAGRRAEYRFWRLLTVARLPGDPLPCVPGEGVLWRWRLIGGAGSSARPPAGLLARLAPVVSPRAARSRRPVGGEQGAVGLNALPLPALHVERGGRPGSRRGRCRLRGVRACRDVYRNRGRARSRPRRHPDQQHGYRRSTWRHRRHPGRGAWRTPGCDRICQPRRRVPAPQVTCQAATFGCRGAGPGTGRGR